MDFQNKAPLGILVLCTNRPRASATVIISALNSIKCLPEVVLGIVDNSTNDLASAQIYKAFLKCLECLGSKRVNYFKLPKYSPASRNLYYGLLAIETDWVCIFNNRTVINYTLIEQLLVQLNCQKCDLGYLESSDTQPYLHSNSDTVILNKGVVACSYAFNRGSTLAGMVCRRDSFPFNFFYLDSGIYPHVFPSCLAALIGGLFSLATSQPFKASLLDTLDVDGGMLTRPPCYGLTELILSSIKLFKIYIVFHETGPVVLNNFLDQFGYLNLNHLSSPLYSDYSCQYFFFNSLLGPKVSWAYGLYIELLNSSKQLEANDFLDKIFICCQNSEYSLVLMDIFKPLTTHRTV